MLSALTIDVEDAYAVFARDRLGLDLPQTDAVVRSTERLLARLAAHSARATFFVLGEVAEAFPNLVRRIAGAGHEVGVHGYRHMQLFRLTPDEFRREAGDAKRRIEDLVGHRVRGHRAPAFSIRPDTAWGLQVLAELGFEYDSSIFPISGKRYGWPGFPPEIHEMKLPSGARIVEAPPSTVRILGRALPVCGGGYLRHFPYAVTRWAMRRIERTRPAIVYLHPYDIDMSPPPAGFAAALREAPPEVRKFYRGQLRNRETVEPKLERLLDEFRLVPLGEVISSLGLE
jgi:polysaccharide deacetylase family protein (PEP-CTERM system associated)